jgi:hypothetical protein
VSSLITDMPTERSAARRAIEAVGARPVLFEDLGAQDIPAEQAYLSGVRTSEIYVGLWGARYGVRMADGYSATHAEFLEAERHGLRLCLFVDSYSTGEMDGPQRDLIASARNLYTTSPWSDPQDLETRLRRRLEDLATEDLTPWVRVGRAIFRAHEIENDGRQISISASVHSGSVHAELVRLREQRAGSVPFASPGDARSVRVSDVTTRTVSTARHDEQIVLTPDGYQSSSMRTSINNVSADEVTRRALSDGLFDTSLLGGASWTTPADPLMPLRGLSLDDSLLRPVARLLLTEYLLRDGMASTVDAFALGPSHQGVRRLRATWTPRQQYTNLPEPAPLTIDGSVTGL